MENRTKNRTAIGGLIVSASLLASVAFNEGYTEKAIQPLPGDKFTAGFGDTIGVHKNTRIDPVRAVILLSNDLDKRKAALASCVHVPLSQSEFSAYMDLSYNIGIPAFCHSQIVAHLNRKDYAGACLHILDWNKFHGKVNAGLAKRRYSEFTQCSAS